MPLLPAEATKLKDLYSKFSVAEHDDPRNFYITADKAAIRTRYDKILEIESNIILRKP